MSILVILLIFIVIGGCIGYPIGKYCHSHDLGDHTHVSPNEKHIVVTSDARFLDITIGEDGAKEIAKKYCKENLKTKVYIFKRILVTEANIPIVTENDR